MTRRQPNPVQHDVHLDADVAKRLHRLARRTHLSIDEILELGVDLLERIGPDALSLKSLERVARQEQIRRGLQRRTAVDVLREQGFVGSAEGPPDLSMTYCQGAVDSLVRKHGDR
ncbi:MAG TPA: hypothetical protein VHQ65_06115 [Thermoanaerobaculia bacterium]|nr:hypothetical protein [Thermoanaerobaculia bacterium]